MERWSDNLHSPVPPAKTFTAKTHQFMFAVSNHPHAQVPVLLIQAFSPDILRSGMNSRADASLTPTILLSSSQPSNNIYPTRPYNVNLIPSSASLTKISLRDPLVWATLRPCIGELIVKEKYKFYKQEDSHKIVTFLSTDSKWI